ncbi:MAG: peptide chain release factor N(5)-glutamine methyltransferase [Hyphomonadaceae bacterium]|nr:peptide chain release factor N(5)-glutamine methyltransferase [Hyphomonadaceae bacterium]
MDHTLVSLWTDIRRRLEAAGVDSPVLDARLLIEAGAGVSRLEIVTDPRRPLSDAQVAAVDALAARREAREPIGHILGKKAFWTFDLAVSRDVLTPRPETELVVEAGLALLPKGEARRVLDLGVGSGAILFALLSERPETSGVGIDRSAEALAVARANAERLGLHHRADLRPGDWLAEIGERFDLIVSNPPYIVSAEIDALEPEVARFEPLLALDGGADGLDAYRAIFAGLDRALAPGGAFIFEVGRGQAEPVQALAAAHGFTADAPLTDLAGIARVVRGRRAA